MTNAGRILILAKGAWDATSTYEQLDLVTYNQIAYIARKMSTGVNPAADLVYEYWMPFGSAAEIATTERAGLVMPDGTTITITERGLISANLGLDDLTNVDVALPLTNQVLRYNGTLWEAKTLGAAADKATTNAVTQDSTALVESGAVYTETSALSESISTLGNNNDAMLNVLGAKNLLPNNATSQTVNGVTFTVNSDGTVTVSTGSGGATANAVFIWKFDLDAGSYILSSGRNDTSWLTYCVLVYKADVVDIADYQGGAFTLSAKTTGIECRVRVANGTVITTPITFYPMIRPASVADDTYVPYAATNRDLTAQTIIHHGTASGTTDAYGRIVTSINANNIFVLKAYVMGQSYLVTPYIYRANTSSNELLNFVVEKSNDISNPRVSNTSVTIDYFYVNK